MNTHNNGQQTTVTGQDMQIPPVQKQPEPPHAVSGPHKESGPIMEAPVAEYVEPSSPHESEPVLAPEIKEAGVEAVPSSEQPSITEEHKKMGVTHASEAVPVSTTSTLAIQLPYTYPQVQQKVKETPVGESAHWLAVLHKFILERLGTRA